LNTAFLITHISYESPGSFYRPYELAKHLIKMGEEATIYTPFRENLKNSDVPIHTIPISTPKIFSNFIYHSMRKLLYNKKLSKIIPYDKILLSSSKKLEQSLTKMQLNNFDIFQGEQEVASLAAVNLGRKFDMKIVVDIHNIWPEELVSTGHIKKTSEVFHNLMNIEKYILENSDGIIAVNEFMKEYLISTFNIEKSKIKIIPPGGELLLKLNHKKQFTEKEINVIYAGLVNTREHVDLFVKSIPYVLKQFPQTKFIISERGEDINKIKQLCNSLKINPNFYWFKSRDEARNLIKKCDIGILSSIDDIGRKLGTPLKLLEYMSFGIPIVANDVGSWCKIINDEKIGILTKDEPEDFAQGICNLIKNKETYQIMKKNSIKLLEEKFSWKIHVEKSLLPFYHHLCK